MSATTDPTLRGMLRRELGRLGLDEQQITALLPVRVPGPARPAREDGSDPDDWGRVDLTPGVRGGFTNAVRRLWKTAPPEREQIAVIVRLMDDGWTAGDAMLVLRSHLTLNEILPLAARWGGDGMKRLVLYADSMRHAGVSLPDFVDLVFQSGASSSIHRRIVLCVCLVGRIETPQQFQVEFERWRDAAVGDDSIRDDGEDLLRRMRNYYKVTSPAKAFAYYCARIPIPEAVEFEADPSIDESAVEMLAALRGMGM